MSERSETIYYAGKRSKTKYYAGIGSRQTPEGILELMKELGGYLANKGYVLRSGGADGADSAFEEGCDLLNGEKQIFLPWKDFNDKKSKYIIEKMKGKDEAFKIASEFHPKWSSLRNSVKNLMGRNSFQILGPDLKTKSDFVVCYCIEDRDGNPSGGTGQALRIAKSNNIKIYNLYRKEDLNKVKKALGK